MARGTSGKRTPGDRDGLRYLWSLLYRAVRREHTRVENALRSVASIARRLGAISTELTELRSRVEQLERRCWSDHDARRTDR
jgi:hypothetical protein